MTRDQIALIIGVLLGVGSCVLIYISGMAAGAALLVTLFFCPLITSLIASKRIFLCGLVPNVLIVVGGSIFGASSPYRTTAEELLLIILSNIVIGAVFALFMSALVWAVRKKILNRGVS